MYSYTQTHIHKPYSEDEIRVAKCAHIMVQVAWVGQTCHLTLGWSYHGFRLFHFPRGGLSTFLGL